MSITKTRFIIFSFVLFLLIIAEVAFIYGQNVLQNRVFPHTLAASLNLSYQTDEEARAMISQALDVLERSLIIIYHQDIPYPFSIDDLGIQLLSVDEILETIPFIDVSPSNFQNFLREFFRKRHISMLKSINFSKLESALTTFIPKLNQFERNAGLSFDEHWQLAITPEQEGIQIDLQRLYDDLKTNVEQLKNEPVMLHSTVIYPRIRVSDLTLLLPTLQNMLHQSVTARYEDFSLEISLNEYLDAVQFEFQEFYDIHGEHIPITFDDDFSLFEQRDDLQTGFLPYLSLDHDRMIEKIDDIIDFDLEIETLNVTIIRDANDDIFFDGTARDGRYIQKSLFIQQLELAFNEGISEISLPVKEVKARVNAPFDLKEKGIRELIATGYSNFYGSPENRIHNIKLGISRFDGQLVAPGKEFSVATILGEVDETTGYKKELVIKEGNTIPEYGGGLCQVSSTLFRAILFGGFPISERRPHSYAVSYYARPLGYGLDATIYPPYVDLKFKNDTSSYILIQAYVDGYDAYFKFYGTNDGREVLMDGPYIDNPTDPPPDVIVYTDELPPGEKKKVDSAHDGFEATWYRTVIKHSEDDQEEPEKETIFSRYNAWPNRYLVGKDEVEDS